MALINVDMMEYPVIAFVGKRGSGKTLFMTAMAIDEYKLTKRHIYANYHLYGVPYTYMDFSVMIRSLDKLKNCLLLVDEAHVGVDSYNFLSKEVQKVTQFITQIRKRKITMYISTQDFSTVAKRLRKQTDYLIFCTRTRVKGVSNYEMYELNTKKNEALLWQKVFDLRGYFGYYSTDEIILLDEEEEKENKSN